MSNNFFAVLSRMKYIKRWGLMRSTREENLSEHSLETAFIAHALCEIGNKRLGKSYDCGKAVLLAIYHDATEIITGDLPTPIKYDNAAIKTAYKDIETSAARRLIGMLPEDIADSYDELLSCKDKDYHAIVKAADKISAYIKCIEEENMGNREFSVAKFSTEAAIARLNVAEADIFIREFIPAYSLTLDEQSGEASKARPKQ